MKKIFIYVLILFSILLTGCTASTKNDILDNSNEIEQDTATINQTFINNSLSSINSFAYKTMKELVDLNSNKDLFYSPASFYIAMSMLAEGSGDNTYTEIMGLIKLQLYI